jgi:hypothetical protein
MLSSAVLLGLIAPALAQPPGRAGARGETVEGFVAKMMAFDKNGDGKLSREEVTDARLLRLFDRADANKDGIVTRDELVALYQKENVGGGRGFGGDGPPGGPGGPDRPGSRGGPPRPGQVLPPFAEGQLNLTDDQKKQIADLQKEVDSRLDAILTANQKARVREMRGRGPGGPPPQ